MNITTGIADEAASGIAEQIRAHQLLGWSTLELRTVHGRNVAGALSDVEFDAVCDQLGAASLQVTAFASAIGNWSRPIDGDFSQDVADLKIAAKRMQRLGTKFIRTMSWLPGSQDDAAWKTETIRRYRELARIAEDHDIYLAHENCTGWAGQSAAHMRALIEAVSSEHLVLLFDIGNTISHGYEPWEFYRGIKDLIRYVHVKDCRRAANGGRSDRYTLPGEGDALVREILRDLLQSGYDGVISIEPHIARIIHETENAPDPAQMFHSYLDYARRFSEIVAQAREYSR